MKIILSSYDQSYDISKEKLLKFFPQSFFGLALQDPEATEIVIDNPDVIPLAMEILYIILEGDSKFIQYKIEENLESSSRYLLIPELKLFMNSWFLDLLKVRPYQQITNPFHSGIYNTNIYLFMMRFAIREKYYEYIILRGTKSHLN